MTTWIVPVHHKSQLHGEERWKWPPLHFCPNSKTELICGSSLSAASQLHTQRLNIWCHNYMQMKFIVFCIVPVDKDGNSLLSHLYFISFKGCVWSKTTTHGTKKRMRIQHKEKNGNVSYTNNPKEQHRGEEDHRPSLSIVMLFLLPHHLRDQRILYLNITLEKSI